MAVRCFRELSEDAVAGLARALAPHLKPGDVILLDGPLGAGKTHFARALIQARLSAAGRPEDVPSPSYTLVQCYDDGLAEIWHSDLYRLSGPDEVLELGLDEAFEMAICLVEWPDRLLGHVPVGALWLRFAFARDGAARDVTAEWNANRWTALLDRVTVDA